MKAKSYYQVLCVVLSVTQFLPAVAQAADYSFGQFSVSSIYKGKTRLPDFAGRDRDYKTYRTRIREGLKEGPNFAGQFSVIQFGCGTGCSFAFVASNKSGQVFSFPRGGEENMYMQIEKKLDSRLLIVQWGNYDSNSCTIEYFEWNGTSAIALDQSSVGPLEACYNDIKENLKTQ